MSIAIAKHILLTGATGVLGRELVPRLFREHPGARITCLLRPDRNGSIAERHDSLGSARDAGRLDAVAGDIAVPHLGLDATTRRDLRRSVTHVIHGAATTRLDEAPEIAKSINFDGTVRVLAFAESCRNLELFAHVSTAYVCGDREGLVLESDLWRDQSFLNSYEETKCRSEFEVRRRSLDLPVAVFRPSIIVGDSRDGRIASFGSLYSPLRHIAEGTLRRMPCSAEARVDLIPVDYVAEAIARLTARKCAVGEVYQLCAGPGRRVTMKHLFGETIRIAGNGAGPPMRFDPGGLRVAPEGTPPRLRVFFDYLHFDREFSIARVQEHLGADVVSPPADFVTPMLEYCRRTDWGRRSAREEVLA
jgi:thioester reductase-like protein